MVYCKNKIIDNIAETIGSSPLESGGIIGIYKDVICAYCFDPKGSNQDKYFPDINSLNGVIQTWMEHEVEFVGIVHSQTDDFKIPPKRDLEYALLLKQANPEIKRLIFPIVHVGEQINIYFYELIGEEFVQIEVKSIE